MLSDSRGHGDDADGQVLLGGDGRQVVDVADDELADALAHLGGVGVDQCGDAEAPRQEAAVVGERVAEMAQPGDHDRPVLGHPQLAADLEEQVADVVADPPRAVRPEVGEVLAHLGRVHPGQLRQPLGGHRGRVGVLHLEERAQVHGEAGHGCFRDAAAERAWHAGIVLGVSCFTKSRSRRHTPVQRRRSGSVWCQ